MAAEVAPPVPILIRTVPQAIPAMDAALRNQQKLPNRCRRYRLPAFHQQQLPLKRTQKQMALRMETRTIAPVVPVPVTLIQNQRLKVNQTEQTATTTITTVAANCTRVAVAAPQAPRLQRTQIQRWKEMGMITMTTKTMIMTMTGCNNQSSNNRRRPPAMPAPMKTTVTALPMPRPHLPAVAVAAA